ncbi:MAG: MFS transporter [Solidesulfovibrio sp. DCME]|uniref:MFS transporter n=1 Tax=Solidesulfovibrio sp. DCME TaxID=3447380 RepID=UPI003D148CC0
MEHHGPQGSTLGNGPQARRSYSLLVRSFRHRNFRLFFAGQFISLVGTWMQSVAVSWLVYRLTGSSLALGAVGFVTHLPVFVLGLWGGCLADRRDKRWLLVTTQVAAMLQAFALAALTLSGAATVWLVGALAMVLGVVNAVDMPTRQAFVVEMVGKEDLHNAIALNSSMFNSARVLGPALAGLLVAAVGEGVCFLLNAISYLAVIASLLCMRLPPATGCRAEEPMGAHIFEGLRHAWQDRAMRGILASLCLASLFGASFMILLPVMTDAVLGHGAQGLGFLTAAAGVGSVVAALTLAVRPQSRGLGRIRVLAGMGFGATLTAFALSRAFWLSLCLSPVLGFFLILFFAAANTSLQLRSPDALRGRVMALYAITLVGMAPFGSLLAGGLASLIGAPATLAVCGAVCGLGVGVLAATLPAGDIPPSARAS